MSTLILLGLFVASGLINSNEQKQNRNNAYVRSKEEEEKLAKMMLGKNNRDAKRIFKNYM